MTEYYTPTRVLFGKGAETKLGETLKKDGYKRALLHYGGKSAVQSGLLDRIEADLNENGIDVIKVGGVVPNPRVTKVREAIEKAKEHKSEIIIALGGGSVIDSAKAIAYGLFNHDGDIWDYYLGERKVKGAFPLAVILTLSATGSEMSASSVISNDEGPGYKRGLNSEWGRPKYAFLNPELTYSVSRYQTASGSADIMMHTLERFFHSGNGLMLTDDLAVSLLKTVMIYTPIAISDPSNYEARANLMWAGALSHNGLMNMGADSRGDWACHQMEHELSAKFDVAHGAGLTAIWSSWAKYVFPSIEDRLCILGEKLFSLEGEKEKIARETIYEMEKFFLSIDMPIRIDGLGIDLTEDDISDLSYGATFHRKRTIGDSFKLGEKEISDIYRLARS